MPLASIRKIAGLLKILVTVTFVCNLLVLLLVPGLAFAAPGVGEGIWSGYGAPPGGLSYFALCWSAVWGNGYTAVLTLFLWFCGGCTAVILWQGRRVLDTVLRGEPFSLENAISLRRAAVCAFLIAAAALARLVWGFGVYRSLAPLATYNALFVPVFAMAGLLCLVMSALFRRAAEIKAENDLTI